MIGFANAALPHMSDFDPGSGDTTPGLTSQNVINTLGPGEKVAGHLEGTTAGHPVTWWVVLILFFLVVKWAAERSGEGNFSNIKIGAYSMFAVWGMWKVFDMLMKWIFGTYQIPGLSALVLS